MLQGSLGMRRDDIGEASGECVDEDSGSLPEASGRLRWGFGEAAGRLCGCFGEAL